ncbi:MAG: hypothetical protein D6B26_07310, partial [Spirochaetaceae bacterium]
MVRQLIESFVDPALASQIDFDDFQPLIEKSYIAQNMRDFADDLLVRVRLKDQPKQPAYIYLMIEFQSKPDRFMSLRLLNYITLFYLDYLKENPKARMLPPVFPLVLYNGKARWNSPDSLRDIIESNDFCRQFTPDFRYLTIEERKYPTGKLLQVGNAVATVFMLENSTANDFDRLADQLGEMLKNESAHTIALLAQWMRHLFVNKKVDISVYNEINLI